MPKQWGGKATNKNWGSIAKGGPITVSRLSTGEFLREEPSGYRFRRSSKKKVPKIKFRSGKVQYKIATEKLMFSVLDIMFKGKSHKDHYRPKWLRNPDTGKELELDRYYPGLKLAFEYNGRHHNNKYQIYKDGIKRTTCIDRNIVLVVIKSAETLSVEQVQHLIDEARKELEEKRSV